MARLIKPLTATQISNAKAKEKLYKLFDGGGLFLQVNPSGGKHWKMKYKKNDGNESVLSFGSYPALTLEQARKKREEAKSLIVHGIDPAIAKQEEKTERINKALNTFERVTYEWLEIHATKTKASTLSEYKSLLERYVLPYIGKQSISNLKALDFLEVIRKIENKGIYHTAKRVKIICGMIMRYAVAIGRAESDPLSSLKGALKSYQPKHYASTIQPKEVGSILQRIYQYNTNIIASFLLKILPYVFVRPGELREAQWKEIDFETCEWRYIATKTNTQHIVPLAPQVVALLKDLYGITGSGEWLFPSSNKTVNCISKTSLLSAIRNAKITEKEMTLHGFRAMARTMLDEELGERYDLIEMQLAHRVRDPNGRAYNRTQHLAERHRMMARWADYLDKLRDEAEEEKLS